MSLEDFYFVSQIAAAVGIMLSLIFVGLQIRQNTAQSKADAAESAHRGLIEWLNGNVNADIAPLVIKSNTDFDSVTPEEYVVIAAGTTQLLLAMQEAHAKFLDGSLIESRWRVWDNYAQFSIVPSVVAIFKQRRSMFSDEFQAFFDSKIAEGDVRPRMHAHELEAFKKSEAAQ